MKNEPFLLSPAEKDYLWGGTRLRDEYGKGNGNVILAETWECSVHPDGKSFIASGAQNGKTELWYVLQADEGATIRYGFQRDMTRREVERAAYDGSIEKLVRKVPVKKNDVFFVEAGTVHAIGRGIVIAEIQQSSNLTYRLYDYDRTDRDGRKRPLHIEKALDVLHYQSSIAPRQPMRVLNYRNGYATELLGQCKYFRVERMLLNTERCRALANIKTDRNSFQILLCIDGCGVIFGEDVMLNFFKGDCIFLPAESIPLKLYGKAQLLKIGC